MKNIISEVKDDILYLKVDLKRTIGDSKSGKSTLIATTSGNVDIKGAEGVMAGINIYRKKEK